MAPGIPPHWLADHCRTDREALRDEPAVITPTILIIAGLVVLNVIQAARISVLSRKLWIAEVTERTKP